MSRFDVTVAVRNGLAAVRVEGEVDMTTAPMLLDAILCAAIGHGPCNVAVDLRNVSFMDSTGIHVLAIAHRRLVPEGCHLVVCSPSGLVRRILEITGLDDVLDVRVRGMAAAA